MIYGDIELYNVAEIFAVPDHIAGPSLDSEGGPGPTVLGGGVGLSRIPLALRPKLNESAQANSLQAAGCEIRLNLLEDVATVTLEMTEHPAIVEVYSGSFLIDWHVIGTEPTEIPIPRPPRRDLLRSTLQRQDLAFDPDLYRVVLPWRPPVRFHGIEGRVAPPRRDQVPGTRYLAYGSSITHGARSVRGTGGYAMRTAQRLGVDLINLGLGGGAHLEVEMADYIASRSDWDFTTLELGINLVSWLETEAFAERVDTFITRIAEAHRDKWIFCIDMFPFYMDFDPESERNHAYRAVVRETVERLALPRLLHLDGRDLLRDVAGLCADLVHPSASGMEEIATNLATRIERTMSSGIVPTGTGDDQVRAG